MSQQSAQIFVDALRTLEESGIAEPLAALYSEKAVIENILASEGFQGPDGALKFWTEYRGTFTQVKSEFRNIIADNERAALEWTTQGTAFDGKSIHYSGVTLLEMDGGKITRSCAYFDPAALGRQMIGE